MATRIVGQRGVAGGMQRRGSRGPRAAGLAEAVREQDRRLVSRGFRGGQSDAVGTFQAGVLRVHGAHREKTVPDSMDSPGCLSILMGMDRNALRHMALAVSSPGRAARRRGAYCIQSPAYG